MYSKLFTSEIQELMSSIANDLTRFESRLSKPLKEGGWSPLQVIHHLADASLVIYLRVRRILTEDNPLLQSWDQDKWAEEEFYRDVDTSLHAKMLFLELNTRIIYLLRGTSEDDFERKATHSELGDIKLTDILSLHTKHLKAHSNQLKLHK